MNARVTNGWLMGIGGLAIIVITAAVVWAVLDDDEQGNGNGDGYPTVLEPAPIESVELRIAESFPPQYFLAVVSGLPNSCVRLEGYEVARDGNDVVVTVTNRVPAPDAGVVCAQVYGTVESNIALGSEFTSGETYRVFVNGKQYEEFVGQ
jgi:hypothetical protein